MAQQDATIGVEAHVTLDGKAFLGRKVSYGCNRNADERGAPTDAPKPRLIRMMLVPQASDDFALLYDWAFKNDRKLSGQVEFKYSNNSQVLRRIEFEEAYCVGFRETFVYSDAGINAAHVPDLKNYKPEHRGAPYFPQNPDPGAMYELVLLPQKMKIGQVEIES
ncbi:type VI secretion system tube protein TssD [Dyadobacter sandarakinus]|uniref:Aspartyl/glutamyl-tRNA(Asn/Gln) amidotransferase subunit B n=1 Tax=Dyadobacter sandarakinus TaxID=2747268 RepID=A0ABX7IA77_9BACT|nr:type VI secretion system tube protein TssD [Dyadobacter sandarakinus]QRR03016.1 hypothetical protein HWI92_19935 [Dyadobacter sandarakinus]